MSNQAYFPIVVLGLVLALGLYPQAEATKVKGFVDYVDVKCKGGDILKETKADKSDDCYQKCKDKNKCVAAHYNKDLDGRCVLFKECKKWKKVYGWGFAGRVSRKTKYYKAPKGFYCSNCRLLATPTVTSSFGRCIKRCDKKVGCKQVEYNKATKQCSLWSHGLTMTATSTDFVTAKKKKRTQ